MGSVMSEDSDFAAVRKIIEDKLHQEYYNVPTKDLPPRMQPRQLPNLQDAAKIDWDDWKKWEWMQPGWKGIKMHSQCVEVSERLWRCTNEAGRFARAALALLVASLASEVLALAERTPRHVF